MLSMKPAYYNEIDQFACEWLRNLIDADLIPPGHVDSRSITDVTPNDLLGYGQCHFFAGIGGWGLAFRLAGVPDDAEWWSGSCPCQPFSSAGKRQGHDDERHLWPELLRLITAVRPPVVFGEQVASADVVGKAGGKATGTDRLVWLDGICADLEAAHYTVGACDLPAACIGAPHIRQRLYWVGQLGNTDITQQRGRWCLRRESRCEVSTERGDAGGVANTGSPPSRDISRPDMQSSAERPKETAEPARRRRTGRTPVCVEPNYHGERLCKELDGLADTEGSRGQSDSRAIPGVQGEARGNECVIATGGCEINRLGDSTQRGLGVDGCASGNAGHAPQPDTTDRLGHDTGSLLEGRACLPEHPEQELPTAERACRDAWADYTIVHCRDGKARRISAQPGDEPLAYGIPVKLGPSLAPLRSLAKDARRNRVGRLRAYGNATVPELAAKFVLAYIDTIH